MTSSTHAINQVTRSQSRATMQIMETALHLELSALEAGLAEIRQSPLDTGRVELVIRRPSEGEREVLTEAELDPQLGVVGDDWLNRSGDPADQVTVMNARAVALIAR